MATLRRSSNPNSCDHTSHVAVFRSFVSVHAGESRSLLLQQGESVVYVKEQLGHGSIQITVDTYGHLIPGANRAAVDRLDDAQPAATPAQPAAGEEALDASELEELFGESGEPNPRELEPDRCVAEAAGEPPRRGVKLIL